MKRGWRGYAAGTEALALFFVPREEEPRDQVLDLAGRVRAAVSCWMFSSDGAQNPRRARTVTPERFTRTSTSWNLPSDGATVEL